MNDIFKAIGIAPADILVPADGIDKTKWAVVACDQFTSDKEYWNRVCATVKDSPSTLNMIFPEIYLEDENPEQRIENINRTMDNYIENNIFQEYKDAMIFVKRTQSNGKVRKGIMLCVDLEQYDFNKGSVSKIRATEGTIISRIPPRVAIREKAALEFPHIMILIDDPKKTVIEPFLNEELLVVYDCDLMEGGGHLQGALLNHEQQLDVAKNLLAICDKNEFLNKYDLKEDYATLLFAVGDGNHSLATAKTCWENIKKSLDDSEKENHPARFALVELVNLHDEALEFEPIHRILYNVDKIDFLNEFINSVCKDDGDFKQDVEIVINGFKQKMRMNRKSNLPVGTLQEFLDSYLESHKECRIDYVHEESTVIDKTMEGNNIGFILPAMPKKQLFKSVILDGALPRKTFSMGEGMDKRYYFEGRRIK